MLTGRDAIHHTAMPYTSQHTANNWGQANHSGCRPLSRCARRGTIRVVNAMRELILSEIWHHQWLAGDLMTVAGDPVRVV